MSVATAAEGPVGAASEAHADRVALIERAQRAAYAVLGVAIFLALWWLGGYLIATDPDMAAFSDFAPLPTFLMLGRIIADGSLWGSIWPSLSRILMGLAWSIAIGVPVGIAIGRVRAVRSLTHTPFQFLRMVSPLAWMPIAVLVFATWDGAIVFLIAAAAVWPVTFATANGLRKLDPHWFKVTRNLGARPVALLRYILLPAIGQDILTGIRLALGVAWIILVPAEYLGVTSGLGYAINDARDTFEYDRLTAIVLAIGAIGFALDGFLVYLIRRASWQDEG